MTVSYDAGNGEYAVIGEGVPGRCGTIQVQATKGGQVVYDTRMQGGLQRIDVKIPVHAAGPGSAQIRIVCDSSPLAATDIRISRFAVLTALYAGSPAVSEVADASSEVVRSPELHQELKAWLLEQPKRLASAMPVIDKLPSPAQAELLKSVVQDAKAGSDVCLIAARKLSALLHEPDARTAAAMLAARRDPPVAGTVIDMIEHRPLASLYKATAGSIAANPLVHERYFALLRRLPDTEFSRSAFADARSSVEAGAADAFATQVFDCSLAGSDATAYVAGLIRSDKPASRTLGLRYLDRVERDARIIAALRSVWKQSDEAIQSQMLPSLRMAVASDPALFKEIAQGARKGVLPSVLVAGLELAGRYDDPAVVATYRDAIADPLLRPAASTFFIAAPAAIKRDGFALLLQQEPDNIYLIAGLQSFDEPLYRKRVLEFAGSGDDAQFSWAVARVRMFTDIPVGLLKELHERYHGIGSPRADALLSVIAQSGQDGADYAYGRMMTAPGSGGTHRAQILGSVVQKAGGAVLAEIVNRITAFDAKDLAAILPALRDSRHPLDCTKLSFVMDVPALRKTMLYQDVIWAWSVRCPAGFPDAMMRYLPLMSEDECRYLVANIPLVIDEYPDARVLAQSADRLLSVALEARNTRAVRMDVMDAYRKLGVTPGDAAARMLRASVADDVERAAMTELLGPSGR